MNIAAIGKRLFALPTILMIVGIAILSAPSRTFAANYTSLKTGNWSDPTVWSGGIVPAAGDNVTIVSPHIVTMDASAVITNLTVAGTLQFTNAATAYTLGFDAGSAIAVNGTLDMGVLGVLLTGSSGTTTLTMGASAILKTSNTNGIEGGAGTSFQTQGTGAFNLASLNTSGTVNYIAPAPGGAAYTITDRNYNNLTLTGAGLYTWTLAADRTINGTWLCQNPTKLTLVGTQTISIGVNLNTQFPANGLEPGTSTIAMIGTGAHFINHNGPPWNNFLYNKTSGALTTYANVSFNGTVTIASGTFNPAHAFTVKGTFTNNATATGLSGWNFGGDFVNNGTFSTGAAATTFNGTAPQSISSITPLTFTSLAVNNTAGVTLNQNATVTSAMGLTAGAFTLTSPLTLNSGVTITRTGAGSFAGIPTFLGTVNLSYTNSVSNPIITPGTELPASLTALNNFSISGTTVNLASDLTVNGLVSLGYGSTFNAGAFNINIKGQWSNSAGVTAFNAGSGTVTWNGASTSIAGSYATTFNNLTVNIGANTLTMSIAPTVNGVLTLSSGTVALGTIGLIAKGNVVNNFSATPFTGTTGVFQVAGVSPQTLGGSFPTTFTRLTMNNPAGLTLGSNATVTLGLILTNGEIVTGANSLALSTTSTTITRTNGYVNGNFTKPLAAGSNQTKVFEIGSGTGYAPVSLTFASITTAGSLTASTVGSEHPDILNSGLDASLDVNRYWSISNNGLAFNNYNATFNFNAADVDAGADWNIFEPRKHNSPNWTIPATGARTATSTQATGLTSFSDFAIGTVIPVTPSAPTLTSPSNGALDIAITPTLTWGSVYGADTYELTVATDPGFTNTVINQSGLTSTSYAVVAPLNNSTTYYWHVTATNVAGTSIPSADWSFTTIIAAPPAPALTAPANGTTEVSITPLLSWEAATGATTYRVQIASDPAFLTLIIDQAGIATTSYTVSLALGTSTLYYWRVNATNVGGTGPYSAINNFTTILAPPAVPTLLSPADLTVNVSIIPTLNWNSVIGATSYSIRVATDAGFTNVVVNQAGVTGTSYSISPPLASSTVHYWQVSATNDGGTSAYSTAWSFTTRTPATITSTKTGNWNDPTAWSTGYIPSLGDAVVIAAGHTITMDASAVITNLTVAGTLQFTNAATAYTLGFDAGSAIAVNGTLDMGVLGVLLTGSSGTTTLTMGASAILKTSNTNGIEGGAGTSFQTQGTGAFNLASLNTSGTVNYIAPAPGGAAYTITDRNYNNLTLTGAGLYTWTLAADRTINGTWLCQNPTKLTLVGTQTISIGVNLNTQFPANGLEPGTSTIAMIGTGAHFINHNGPPWNNFLYNKTSGALTTYANVSFNGTVTIASGTFNPAHAFTVKGTFTNNATATGLSGWNFGGDFVNNGTFSTGAAATTFNGTAPQSISSITPLTFTSLAVNNTAGVTLNQNATVTSAMGLTAGAFTLTSPLTLNSGVTITRTGAGSFAGIPTFLGTVNLSYTNSVSNPIITPGTELPASLTALNNFSISGTTVNLASDLTVNGLVSLGYGSTFNAGAFNINIKGQWSNSAGVTAFNAGSGTVTWNGASTSIAGSYATTFNNLTVNIGANTLTMSIAPTVNGVLTLSSGTVALGTIGLIAKGNVVNNFSATPFTGTTGVFQVAGVSPQTLGGSFPTTFTRLTMNNPAGLTLGSNATVTLGLILTNGEIVTGANSLALSTTSTTITRTNGYVNGNFTKPLAAGSNQTKVFEIGSGTGYAPVSLTFASITTAGSLTASTVGSEHPDILNSGLDAFMDVNRYWSITNNALVFTMYSASFTFLSADVDPGANTNIFLAKQYNSGVWSSPTTGTRTATSTQATDLTAFGDFAVGELIPPAPSAPTLVSPLDGAINVSTTPTIIWHAVAGARNYGLEVATDAGFTNIILTQTGIADTLFAVVTPLSNSMTYYWHVNATNGGGTSVYSAAWSFTTLLPPPPVPVLSSPTDLATNVALLPILTWSAAAGADSYTLQVATDAAFTALVINQAGIAVTSYTVTTALTYNTIYYWHVNASNAGGTSAFSGTFSYTTLFPSHNIALSSGWNMISSYLNPQNPALEIMAAGIQSNLVIMKNIAGQIYWPAYGINQIGSWTSTEGYQVYMSAGASLAVTGSLVMPETTPISLHSGWNLVSYLRYSSMAIQSALGAIASDLVIVKNNIGRVYWPVYGINTIGNVNPGEAYQMYLSAASTLIYPGNTGILPKAHSSVADRSQPMASHYQSSVSKTGSSAILLVQSTELKDADEIAIWTRDKMLVGAGVVYQNQAIVTVWGDNVITKNLVDGAAEEEPLSMTHWSASENEETPLAILSLADGLTRQPIQKSLLYKTDAIWLAEAAAANNTPDGFALFQNYPNPFNPSTVIKYSLPRELKVTLEIINVLGQRVAVLVDATQKAGYHEVTFINPNLGSGYYYYHMSAGEFSSTRQMVIMK